jgi:type VI secretion system protein VasD
MKRRAVLVLPLAAAGASLLHGCASPPPPPPTLELTVEAGADQNPDVVGKPAPVAVHIFQLASTARFERADVFALIEREKETLGEEGLGSEEFVVAPGENRKITRDLKVNTQFLGVAVLFRDIDHATWRAVAPVARSGPSKLVLRTKGIVATLASAS